MHFTGIRITAFIMKLRIVLHDTPTFDMFASNDEVGTR